MPSFCFHAILSVLLSEALLVPSLLMFRRDGTAWCHFNLFHGNYSLADFRTMREGRPVSTLNRERHYLQASDFW